MSRHIALRSFGGRPYWSIRVRRDSREVATLCISGWPRRRAACQSWLEEGPLLWNERGRALVGREENVVGLVVVLVVVVLVVLVILVVVVADIGLRIGKKKRCDVVEGV